MKSKHWILKEVRRFGRETAWEVYRPAGGYVGTWCFERDAAQQVPEKSPSLTYRLG